LERIVLSSSKEGDIVLDPFCGSATSGVVAIRHNRKFIGIDSEKKYLDELAKPRILDEIRFKRQSSVSSIFIYKRTTFRL